MQVLSILRALVLAVQLVSAVHFDRPQQLRLIKIKREISNRDGNFEGQPALERRAAPEESLVSGVKELVAKFEELGGHSEPHQQVASDLKKLVDAHEITANKMAPSPLRASTHYFEPDIRAVSVGERYNLVPRPAGHEISPQAWLADHEQKLGEHAQILDDHREGLLHQKAAIEQGLTDLAQHDQKLESLRASQEELKEAQERLGKKVQESPNQMSKSAKFAVYGLGAAALTATGTSIATQHSTNEHLGDMADRIQAQQDEIRRLKGANGEQDATTAGPGGAIASGQGTSDGGLV